MSAEYALIVPDATPLITLAAAGALDLLLKPGIPVSIPDGVHFGTIRYPDKLGATDIVEWLQRSPNVRIEPTQEFRDAMILLEAGRKRSPNMGERCALEVVEMLVRREPGKHAILLYEDSDVLGMRMLRPDLVDTLTTADFLDQLERARLIQSADHILDLAVSGGRDESARNRSMNRRSAIDFSNRSEFGT